MNKLMVFLVMAVLCMSCGSDDHTSPKSYTVTITNGCNRTQYIQFDFKTAVEVASGGRMEIKNVEPGVYTIVSHNSPGDFGWWEHDIVVPEELTHTICGSM